MTRARSDASRRAVAVSLTPTGHRLIEATVRQLLTHEESLIAELTTGERTTLGTLLTKLDASQRRP